MPFFAGLKPGATFAEPQREPPVQKELLERVGYWVERYLKQPPEYAATETRQDSRPTKKGAADERQMVSRFTARRESQVREVVSVNGRSVPADARQETFGLLPERVSHPLALLSRLALRNQDHMKYFFAPDTSDVPSDEVLIGYRPAEGEPLMEIDGKRVWGSGVAWVHPDEGHITRVEEQFEYKNTRYTTAVDFALDEVVKAWVPRQIVVRVFEKGRLQAQRIYAYDGFAPPAAARAETAAPSSKPK